MKIARRIIMVVLFLLQLVFLWAPRELDTLYNTRLGFMRQILFMNENYPVYITEIVFWILIFIALVLLIRWIMKFVQHKKWNSWLSYIWMFLVLLWVIAFAIVPTNQVSPLYLYNLTSFNIVVLLNYVIIGISK
ncbi:hypothetical protein [Companilactobacillus mishanensis]|uniref:Uncharacterized protein n=1 Tax=Companilactobacillus mishanensis TaxID=2486008 RepID=A0ABW9P8P7_9LACO|nr:hypothetical protein [Companilactobacillus mishanensis]MQS45422.1 hypothetical protein [Companilactobacillus mishanensis]